MDILRHSSLSTGTLFKNAVVNAGVVSTSNTIGRLLVNKNDPSLEVVAHVFALGVIENEHRADYGRVGLPLFVVQYPKLTQDHDKLTYLGGPVDLWVPVSISAGDGHVYLKHKHVAALNASVNGVMQTTMEKHAMLQADSYGSSDKTTLKIPNHEFREGDEIKILLEGTGEAALTHMADSHRRVVKIISNDFLEIEYELETSVDNLQNVYAVLDTDSYIVEDSGDTAANNPPIMFLGLNGRLQPAYQIHEFNDIYLIAAVLQGM